ncbi:outer membrane protein OmpA-like peptidoglycan-associated protein [Marinilabilia salmonicolor]|jgi:outer membrane protein OmpA-like peptidoglycan-associated protein|uniref:OmpA family protein n=1 Tax=Marinilabilia salmonicolor TaxID=989 RepID=UPI000D053194|nr:OmpA family protein [Marinilabilia salmonicolor]PRZ00578.1 outer membrane protein OmpA-like peptidoglycan-associated protein [Marinilabilia salmonicolor]
MRKILFVIVISVFVCISANAQQIDFYNLEEEQIYNPARKYNTWSLTAGIGPVVYYTDVVDYSVFPSQNWKFGPSLLVSKQLGRPWSVDAQFLMADMYGEKNSRFFEGDFYDLTLNLNVSINQLVLFGPIRDRLNIYGKIGLGVNYFRARQRNIETGEWITVGDVHGGTPGYPRPYGWSDDDFLAIGYEKDNPEEKTDRGSEMVIPIGLGIDYRINKSFDLGFELMLRNLSQDNLDVNLTGADNDSYMSTAVTVTYKIGKKDKRHALWTYKDFNMGWQRDRRVDPNAQKLDSLRQRLEEIAATDSSVTDTTFIYQEKIEHRKILAASVFFDFDKSAIKPDAHKVIAIVARFMKEHPDEKILVQGYCDERGADDYNVRLSQRRCDAVMDVLVNDYGLDENRITTEPNGEGKLLSDTKKLAPRGVHMVNRRVDIFVVRESNIEE